MVPEVRLLSFAISLMESPDLNNSKEICLERPALDEDKCYVFASIGGGYSSEVSWEILGTDGVSIAFESGEASVKVGLGDAVCKGDVIDPDADSITFTLSDSYGDGWNGAYLIIKKEEGGQTVHTGGGATFLSGHEDSVEIALSEGCYLVTTFGGEYPG